MNSSLFIYYRSKLEAIINIEYYLLISLMDRLYLLSDRFNLIINWQQPVVDV